MKIRFLYIESCPSWRQGLQNLKAALEAEGVNEEIELIEVQDDMYADYYSFLGSPSIHINRKDLWPERLPSYHMGYRAYSTPEGIQGFPTVEMLREKIRQFKPDSRGTDH